jgi:hypothetical protein
LARHTRTDAEIAYYPSLPIFPYPYLLGYPQFPPSALQNPAKTGARWLADGAWVHYGAADFGTTTELVAGFALQGEEVWAATGEGVLRFDGNKWTLYPEAPRCEIVVVQIFPAGETLIASMPPSSLGAAVQVSLFQW